MNEYQDTLALFHPLVARWFADRIGRPTDVQRRAWPKIAAGEHLLITAPTGSGKTLTAFLWAINRLITGRRPESRPVVLYISPLRALNYDIQRNLLGPLRELQRLFQEAGEPFPEIRVLTRSGDTPPAERRQMLRHPPEILISTPESLNLLLSSRGGRSLLSGLSTVILDEIHAVVGTKRGAYLITAVDRLVPLSGEFQRLALSATVRPLREVADFVGGFTMAGDQYLARPVFVIESADRKEYEIAVRHVRPEGDDGVWRPLAREVKKIIFRNRSTLVFANSRRLCEILARLINEEEEEPLAYAHHGSLSLAIRALVERRLKEGRLRAVVATHSLELGIDIGAVDETVLVQSPFSISSAIQRIGRAGHRVGEVSRGSLFATHDRDLLDAAVLAPAVLEQDIEAARPVIAPLDVLAQVIVSMVGVETWKVDTLFRNLKASYPYRHLTRAQFDLVLNMLAGRYAGTRVRELFPRISIDRLENTVAGRPGALQAVYLSGGVIPDRGYFHLRHQETNARIGELDEEFVWEASTGQTFTLGTQTWRIERITHSDVFVLPGRPQAATAPFWKAEGSDREFHFAERIGQFLERMNGRLDDPGLDALLEREDFLEPEAARALIDFLRRQREVTGDLPHRHLLILESVSAGPGNQAVLHTLWGGRVNRPLALALDAAWEARYGFRPEIYVSDDCLVLVLPNDLEGGEILSMLTGAPIESLLRSRLEGSGFFGARFRECAGRALLLPRGRFHERQPLWLSRLRSQKLLEAVRDFGDFPVLLESWRTCLKDEFDLENLGRLLRQLASGEISWRELRTGRPSPFAQSDWWRQVNQYVYMDDRPRSDQTTKLKGDLLRDVIFHPALRPTVSRQMVEHFEGKRQRLSPGYAPQSPRDLLDWVVERLILPEGEWRQLGEAIARDQGVDPGEWTAELEDKLVRFHPTRAREPLVAAREVWPRIRRCLYRDEDLTAESFSGRLLGGEEEDGDGEDGSVLLGEWLRFYGPTTVDLVASALGLDRERLQFALEDLIDAQKVLKGRLVTDGAPDEICDSENFEFLLRLARAAAVPAFEPRELEWLPLFLAQQQGLTRRTSGMEGLFRCIEQLLCYPAEAELWESEIFPARLKPYDPSWLDTLMAEEDLQWMGGEGRRVLFCFSQDLDLVREDGAGSPGAEERPPVQSPPDLGGLFPDPAGRYDFSTLLKASRTSMPDLARRLWNGVWRGEVTNDSFVTLRQAILNKFKIPAAEAGGFRHGLRRRARLARRREGRYFAGHWHLLSAPEPPEDLLEAEERRQDRVRLLLDRYGVLFRELLQREPPLFRWPAIFRSLRLMELSGEVLAGVFFQGIPGPQFISHQAFRNLRDGLPPEAVFWIHAADPASLCGLALEAFRGRLPARLPGTHLVCCGKDPVLVCRRGGQDLTFLVPPDDARLSEYLGLFHHLLSRSFQPVRRIAIESINGGEAPRSPYVPALRASFEVIIDYRRVNLFRRRVFPA